MKKSITVSREFTKLERMLSEAGIPFSTHYDMDRDIHHIWVFLTKGRYLSAIWGKYTYGSERGLLEIMGGLTRAEYSEDQVRGWLTAREVFKRFKYCYEHDTLRFRA